MGIKNANYLKQAIILFIVSMLTVYGASMGLPVIKIIAIFMLLFTLYTDISYFVNHFHKDRKISVFEIILYSWQNIFTVLLLISSYYNNPVLNVITIIAAFITFVLYSFLGA